MMNVKSLLRPGLIVFLCFFIWNRAFAQTDPTPTPTFDPETAAFIESQSSPVVYLSYDVNLNVLKNGRFHVQEIQQVYFKESFRTAFAEIPIVYTTDIADIRVSEGEQPYTLDASALQPNTYWITQDGESYFVDWVYTSTQPGEIRTFTLEYDVEGGLWVYKDGDILEWRAVPSDRSGVPIYSSHVTVTLPEGVTSLQTNAFGPAFTTQQQENQIVFAASEPILDGTAFQVMVTFPHGLVTAETQDWQVAEDRADLQYRITGLQQELEMTPGGTILVTEQQQVAVEAGALYSGYKRWNLANLDAIADLQIFEGDQIFSLDEAGCDYCFWPVETERAYRWARADQTTGDLILDVEQAGSIDLTWYVLPLVKGETTNFALLYEAQGVFQVTSENQQLVWTVVSGYDVPIETAEVVLTFPPGVSLENARLEGGRLQQRSNGRIAILHDGPIPAEGSWQIRLTLPASATTAAKPDWQTDIERAISEGERIRAAIRQAEINRARTQLGFGTAGGVILVGGLLGVVALWYVRGRDLPTVTVPFYLNQPPSDLPPGIVAYLLDEQPTAKGALASLFHLATLGLLRLDFTYNLSLVSNWGEPLNPDQQIETPTGQTMTIPRHLVTLFNALLPALSKDHERPTSLETIHYEFTKALPQVYYQMGQEATQFFSELPAQARHRWLSWGQWLILAALGTTACLWFTLFGSLGQVVFAPSVALAVVGGALVLVSRWMPQRTGAGVEEAAKWRAFREYLKNLKTYEAEVQPILDRYFAYAVALDVEEVVLAQAETSGGYAPVWTRPIIFTHHERPSLSTTNPSTDPAPQPVPAETPPLLRPTVPDIASPAAQPENVNAKPLSLEGLSQQLTNRLEHASRSLTSILNTAAGDLGDTPFKLVIKGVTQFTWNTAATAFEVMGEILDSAASGDEGGGYGGSSGYSGGRSSSSRSSWSSSRSSSSSRSRSSSGGFSGRSSSSRRSGGGGSRGFGR